MLTKEAESFFERLTTVAKKALFVIDSNDFEPIKKAFDMGRIDEDTYLLVFNNNGNQIDSSKKTFSTTVQAVVSSLGFKNYYLNTETFSWYFSSRTGEVPSHNNKGFDFAYFDFYTKQLTDKICDSLKEYFSGKKSILSNKGVMFFTFSSWVGNNDLFNRMEGWEVQSKIRKGVQSLPNGTDTNKISNSIGWSTNKLRDRSIQILGIVMEALGLEEKNPLKDFHLSSYCCSYMTFQVKSKAEIIREGEIPLLEKQLQRLREEQLDRLMDITKMSLELKKLKQVVVEEDCLLVA